MPFIRDTNKDKKSTEIKTITDLVSKTPPDQLWQLIVILKIILKPNIIRINIFLNNRVDNPIGDLFNSVIEQTSSSSPEEPLLAYNTDNSPLLVQIKSILQNNHHATPKKSSNPIPELQDIYYKVMWQALSERVFVDMKPEDPSTLPQKIRWLRIAFMIGMLSSLGMFYFSFKLLHSISYEEWHIGEVGSYLIATIIAILTYTNAAMLEGTFGQERTIELMLEFQNNKSIRYLLYFGMSQDFHEYYYNILEDVSYAKFESRLITIRLLAIIGSAMNNPYLIYISFDPLINQLHSNMENHCSDGFAKFITIFLKLLLIFVIINAAILPIMSNYVFSKKPFYQILHLLRNMRSSCRENIDGTATKKIIHNYIEAYLIIINNMNHDDLNEHYVQFYKNEQHKESIERIQNYIDMLLKTVQKLHGNENHNKIVKKIDRVQLLKKIPKTLLTSLGCYTALNDISVSLKLGEIVHCRYCGLYPGIGAFLISSTLAYVASNSAVEEVTKLPAQWRRSTPSELRKSALYIFLALIFAAVPMALPKYIVAEEYSTSFLGEIGVLLPIAALILGSLYALFSVWKFYHRPEKMLKEVNLFHHDDTNDLSYEQKQILDLHHRNEIQNTAYELKFQLDGMRDADINHMIKPLTDGISLSLSLNFGT